MKETIVTSGELARYVALGIGGFQILANSVLLFRGFTRLSGELAKEGATSRVADLLSTAWVYGVLGNLCVNVVLVAIASALGAGEPLARRLATAIGLYYLVVGLAMYRFAPGRHPGFLVFTALGLLLLAALRLSA